MKFPDQTAQPTSSLSTMSWSVVLISPGALLINERPADLRPVSHVHLKNWFFQMGLETDPAVVGSKIKLARIPFEWDLLLLDKIHHTPASSVYRLNQGPWVQTGSQHEGI